MKRFINNRDKAVENIAVSLARKTLLGGAPSQILEKMTARMAHVNRSIDVRSILHKQEPSNEKPGSFSAFLKTTRRNTKRVREVPKDLLEAAAEVHEDSTDEDPTGDLDEPQQKKHIKTYRITDGVKLNGRDYCTDDYCEIVCDPQNFVGKILSFYKVGHQTFVRVSVQPTEDIVDEVYILRKKEKSGVDFPREYHSIDAIKRKMKRAQHWNNEEWWCGVGMWYAL
jgi:hypothetical protein